MDLILTISHHEDGTETCAYLLTADVVRLVNRAVVVRSWWPTPSARELRAIAARAARARGLTLARGIPRTTQNYPGPLYVAYDYRTA